MCCLEEAYVKHVSTSSDWQEEGRITSVLLAFQCQCKEEWVQSNASLWKFIYIFLPISSGVDGHLLKAEYQAFAHVFLKSRPFYLLSESSAHSFAGVSPSSNFKFNQLRSRIRAPPFSVEREVRQGMQSSKSQKRELLHETPKSPKKKASVLKSLFSGNFRFDLRLRAQKMISLLSPPVVPQKQFINPIGWRT